MIRIKLKCKGFLSEAQTFRLADRARKTLEKFIGLIRKDRRDLQNIKSLESFIYEIIVGFGGTDLSWTKQSVPGKESRIEKVPQFWDKNFGDEAAWGEHHAWAARAWGRKYEKENEETHNFYITLEKTLENVNNFMKSVPEFDSMIGNLSKKLQAKIQYKTHRQFRYLAQHNDSLKVFYYDQKHKDAIVAAIKEFFKTHDVRTTERTHEHGFDSTTQSYGQILASEIVDTEIEGLLNNHRDKTDQHIANTIATKLGTWVKEHNEAHLRGKRLVLADPTVGFKRVEVQR